MRERLGSLTDMSLAPTCRHDVVSEEWGSEPKGQHDEVASKSRKQLSEACGVGAEVGKGSCHQHAMWMEAQDVVVPGVQVSCLHQLDGAFEATWYCINI